MIALLMLNIQLGAGVVVQQANPLPAATASHIGTDSSSVCPNCTPASYSRSEKAVDAGGAKADLQRKDWDTESWKLTSSVYSLNDCNDWS